MQQKTRGAVQLDFNTSDDFNDSLEQQTTSSIFHSLSRLKANSPTPTRTFGDDLKRKKIAKANGKKVAPTNTFLDKHYDVSDDSDDAVECTGENIREVDAYRSSFKRTETTKRRRESTTPPVPSKRPSTPSKPKFKPLDTVEAPTSTDEFSHQKISKRNSTNNTKSSPTKRQRTLPNAFEDSTVDGQTGHAGSPINIDDDECSPPPKKTKTMPQSAPPKIQRAVRNTDMVTPSKPVSATPIRPSSVKSAYESPPDVGKISPGRLVINNVMVEYSSLSITEGSVSVMASEPDLTFAVNAGEKGKGSFRKFVFQHEHIKDAFVCMENRCFGFKYAIKQPQIEKSTYMHTDTDSRSSGFLVFISRGLQQDFSPTINKLLKCESFLSGAKHLSPKQMSFLKEDVGYLKNLKLNDGKYDWRDDAIKKDNQVSPVKSHAPHLKWTRSYDTAGSQIEDVETDTTETTDTTALEPDVIDIDPNELVLNYKNIMLTNADVDRLKEGEFLNDNVIDFYLQHIHDNLENNSKNVHLFHTTFWPLLKKDLQRAAKRVANHTKLYEKNLIFLPFCEGLHWMLFVICYPQSKHRCIMYCDSLGHSPSESHVKVAQDYMKQRWKIEYPDTKDPAPVFRSVTATLPCQENYCDCGVYLLHYIDLMADESYAMVANCMPVNEKNWFTAETIAKKRKGIKERIEAVAMLEARKTNSQSSQKDKSPESPDTISFLEEAAKVPDQEVESISDDIFEEQLLIGGPPMLSKPPLRPESPEIQSGDEDGDTNMKL